MGITASQIPCKAPAEVRTASVSFASKLDTGELLTGTPAVVEVGSSDLTLDQVSVSSAELDINGVSVPIGKAVQFRIQGGSAGRYRLQVTVSTTATPAQTLIALLNLQVV